jgi:hypothetical protein
MDSAAAVKEESPKRLKPNPLKDAVGAKARLPTEAKAIIAHAIISKGVLVVDVDELAEQVGIGKLHRSRLT